MGANGRIVSQRVSCSADTWLTYREDPDLLETIFVYRIHELAQHNQQRLQAHQRQRQSRYFTRYGIVWVRLCFNAPRRRRVELVQGEATISTSEVVHTVPRASSKGNYLHVDRDAIGGEATSLLERSLKLIVVRSDKALFCMLCSWAPEGMPVRHRRKYPDAAVLRKQRAAPREPEAQGATP